MKYIFQPDSPGSLLGVLYRFDQFKRKRLKIVNLERTDDIEIKIAVICQMVGEGGNLEELLYQDWSFTSMEFFHLVNNSAEWKLWLAEANKTRNKMLIEDSYKMLKTAKLDSDNVESITKILKAIQESIKKTEEDEGIRSITYAYVHQPKAVKERWSLG